jgi:hypothetical protein
MLRSAQPLLMNVFHCKEFEREGIKQHSRASYAAPGSAPAKPERSHGDRGNENLTLPSPKKRRGDFDRAA